MIGWHQRLNGHEFEQTLGDTEGQGKPAVLQSMGLQRVRRDSATEQHNWLVQSVVSTEVAAQTSAGAALI